MAVIKKSKYFSLVLLLIGVLVGSVAAFTVMTLTPLKISMWKQEIVDSDFTIDSIVVKPKRTSIKVKLDLTNSDADAHSANVTVSTYDVSDNLLAEESQLTGDVAGGDTVSLTFDIAVAVSDFDDLDVLVEQLT